MATIVTTNTPKIIKNVIFFIRNRLKEKQWLSWIRGRREAENSKNKV